MIERKAQEMIDNNVYSKAFVVLGENCMDYYINPKLKNYVEK